MKKYLLFFVLTGILLFVSGCSNDYAFGSTASVSLTYNGSEYDSVSQNECDYQYNSKDMVYLYSIKKGEWNDSAEAYNVYRHKDDEKTTYLFVIPRPSVRDATPYAFILKIKS